ncbi:acetyl-CoA acetyltransferase [Mycobacterium antarcticum]|nr:acetyl-CoA acetyltransferase [Mycolicibacterium sp. TUM20985]
MGSRTGTGEGSVDPSTPVLVGWASVSRREPDHTASPEAAALMIEATQSMLPTPLADSVLGEVDWIGATDGLTVYADPGRIVAEAMGAPGAHTVLAKVGVMQQTLLSEACRRVQAGTSQLALVVGAEARYRDVRARAAGEVASITAQPAGTVPDETLTVEAELVLRAEVDAGLGGAPGFYALLDSEWRVAHGRGLDAHRDDIARLYSRFTEIAAMNPHAVRPQVRSADWLREHSDANPMVAFPYTKHMVSTWTVDSGSALLFASASTASRLGIPRSTWLFPAAAVESNHVVPVTARTRPSQPAAMRIMAEAVRREAEIDTADIEILDLYSPMPVAVNAAAEGLNVPAGRDLTVTGGMSFAGGPFNSYVFDALVAAAQRLSAEAGEYALVSSVSGLYTKQGLMILAAQPPRRPFTVVDVTDAVAQAEPALPVAEIADGYGTIVASTVTFAGNEAERAIVIVDLATGERTVAYSQDVAVIARFLTTDAPGRPVSVDRGVFAFADPDPSVQSRS